MHWVIDWVTLGYGLGCTGLWTGLHQVIDWVALDHRLGCTELGTGLHWDGSGLHWVWDQFALRLETELGGRPDLIG